MSDSTRWRTGFLIGAQGEIVFSAPRRPERVLRWRAEDGIERPARLLGYHPEMRLAVARGPLRPRVVPLVPAPKPRLTPERWVITIRHNNKGNTVPHVGVITPKRRKWGPVVGIPGRPGAPVLDAQGGLLGVVRRGGRRTAVVLPIRQVMPFLRKVVMGGPQ